MGPSISTIHDVWFTAQAWRDLQGRDGKGRAERLRRKLHGQFEFSRARGRPTTAWLAVFSSLGTNHHESWQWTDIQNLIRTSYQDVWFWLTRRSLVRMDLKHSVSDENAIASSFRYSPHETKPETASSACLLGEMAQQCKVYNEACATTAARDRRHSTNSEAPTLSRPPLPSKPNWTWRYGVCR